MHQKKKQLVDEQGRLCAEWPGGFGKERPRFDCINYYCLGFRLAGSSRKKSLQDFLASWFRGFQAEHDRPLWTELKVRAPMLFQKDFCTKNIAGKAPVASSMFSQAVCEQFRVAAHRDHDFLCLLKRIHKHAFELLPVA